MLAPNSCEQYGDRAPALPQTCEHCSNSVARGLRDAPGVTSAEVDLATGRATVHGAHLDPAALSQVVQSLGYEVVG